MFTGKSSNNAQSCDSSESFSDSLKYKSKSAQDVSIVGCKNLESKFETENENNVGVIASSHNLDNHNTTNESYLTTGSIVEDSFQSAVTNLDGTREVIKSDHNVSSVILLDNSQCLTSTNSCNESTIYNDCTLENTIIKISDISLSNNCRLPVAKNDSDCNDLEVVNKSILTENEKVEMPKNSGECCVDDTSVMNSVNNDTVLSEMEQTENNCCYSKSSEKFYDFEKNMESDFAETCMDNNNENNKNSEDLNSVDLFRFTKPTSTESETSFFDVNETESECFFEVANDGPENALTGSISTTTIILDKNHPSNHFLENGGDKSRVISIYDSKKSTSPNNKCSKNEFLLNQSIEQVEKKMKKSNNKKGNFNKLNKTFDGSNRKNFNKSPKSKRNGSLDLKGKKNSFSNHAEITNNHNTYTHEERDNNNCTPSQNFSSMPDLSLAKTLSSQQSYTILETMNDLKRPVINSPEDSNVKTSTNSFGSSGSNLVGKKTYTKISNEFDLTTSKTETLISAPKQSTPVVAGNKTDETSMNCESLLSSPTSEVLVGCNIEKKLENVDGETKNLNSVPSIGKHEIEISPINSFNEDPLPCIEKKLSSNDETGFDSLENANKTRFSSLENNVFRASQSSINQTTIDLSEPGTDKLKDTQPLNPCPDSKDLDKPMENNCQLNVTIDLTTQVPGVELEETLEKKELKNETEENKVQYSSINGRRESEDKEKVDGKSSTSELPMDNNDRRITVEEPLLTDSKRNSTSSFLSVTSSNASLLYIDNAIMESHQQMNANDNNNINKNKDVKIIKEEVQINSTDNEKWSDGSNLTSPVNMGLPMDCGTTTSVTDVYSKFQCDPNLMELIKEQFTSKDIEKVCSVVEGMSDTVLSNSDFKSEDYDFKKPIFEPHVNGLNSKNIRISFSINNEEKTPEEIFKALSPHSFDFLGSISGKPTGRDLSRESLFVKFDPLVQAPNGVSLIDFTKEVEELNTAIELSPNNNNNNNNSAVEHLLNISPQKNPEIIVPPLTPLSNRNKKSVSEPNIEKLKELQNEIYFMKNLYAEREKANSEKWDDYETQIARLTGEKCLLEQNLKESGDREKSLVKKMQEQNRNVEQLKTIMEEYVKVISALTTELENVKKENEKQIKNLTTEKDTYMIHLQNTEAAFTDVHAKYEKSKKTIINLKTNETMFRKTIAEQMEKMEEYKEKTGEVQEKTRREMEKLREELNEEKILHSQELTRLRAQLRKTELKLEAMQESLEQKIKENQQLTAICDELIEGKK